MKTKNYDVIIVGAGPAGCSAAIYSVRRAMKTLVISKDVGGQAALSPSVENYPGFAKISGVELSAAMEEQAKNLGAEFLYEGVTSIRQTKDKNFVVHCDSSEYESKAVILAFGKTPRELNVPGEQQFKGRGVSYCANCDAPLFKNKTVAVIGGGDAALDAAFYLAQIAKKVFLVHRRDEFRGVETMVAKLKAKSNVELVLNSVVKEFSGDKLLRRVAVENVKTGGPSELAVDGAFVEIGWEFKTELTKGFVNIDESGRIIANSVGETSRQGVFAAGDVTNLPYKQIVIAAGQGAIAALQAYNYIHGTSITSNHSSEIKK